MDPQQEQISKIIFGPLLVMAPVGTGKTLVLTHRVINAIQNGVSPENILCLTFTRDAESDTNLDAGRREKIATYDFSWFLCFLIKG